MKLTPNVFKPVKVPKSTSQGYAGYDNSRENIDPHVRTKVISSQEGTIERTPTADNHIANKKYVDDNAGGGGTVEATVQNNSTGWQNTTTTVSNNSVGWENVESVVSNNSTGWENAESTVSNNSTGWENAESTLNTNSTGWETAQSTLNTNSGDWETAAGVSHSSNADTILGSGAVALDHGTATTDMVINVCYDTSSTPPAANTTTIGSLFIQYTA